MRLPARSLSRSATSGLPRIEGDGTKALPPRAPPLLPPSCGGGGRSLRSAITRGLLAALGRFPRGLSVPPKGGRYRRRIGGGRGASRVAHSTWQQWSRASCTPMRFSRHPPPPCRLRRHVDPALKGGVNQRRLVHPTDGTVAFVARRPHRDPRGAYWFRPVHAPDSQLTTHNSPNNSRLTSDV